jgi:mannose-6-phosphate isomerase-like protein (cupin superfamily)
MKGFRMFRPLLLATAALIHCSSPLQAQVAAPAAPQAREDALDPSPVDPETDVDASMFIGDARLAQPRIDYGNLVFLDMLTPLQSDNPLRPSSRGAVLQYMKAVSQASLAPGLTARGRVPAGDRQVFYMTSGSGTITVNGNDHALREGVGFNLSPDFDFELSNSGSEPMQFYVRWETLPDDYVLTGDIVLFDRFQNDRRVGSHWSHICNGGPHGFNFCTIAPRNMPHPHSHANEEVWIALRGTTILTLGKHLTEMVPGQAYRIPPTGLTAHSNINLADEPAQFLFVGPAQRASTPATPARLDFARLDNRPYNRATEPDVDAFMGSWRDAFPRVEHGNMYFRDMLTALEGGDPLNPARTGAALTNAKAVSFAQLEPGSVAHRVEGEPTDVQQVFYVDSGRGNLQSGDSEFAVEAGDTFILPAGVDFRLTASGDRYLNLYVVSERTPPDAQAARTAYLVDNASAPVTEEAWHNRQRQLAAASDGLQNYSAIHSVELRPMAMSRPYSIFAGSEEIWIAIENDTELLIGKELRRLPAGSAYIVPPTGITAHALINNSDAPARFLRIVR